MMNVDGLNMNIGNAESTRGERSIQRVAVGLAVERDRTTDDLRDVLVLVVFADAPFLGIVALVDALVTAGVVLSTAEISYVVSLPLLALSLVGNVVFVLLSSAVYVARHSMCLYSLYFLYSTGYSALNSYDLVLLAAELFVQSLSRVSVLSLFLVALSVLLSVALLSLNVLLSLLFLVALVSLLSILLTLHAVCGLALADLVVGMRVWVISVLVRVNISIVIPHILVLLLAGQEGLGYNLDGRFRAFYFAVLVLNLLRIILDVDYVVLVLLVGLVFVWDHWAVGYGLLLSGLRDHDEQLKRVSFRATLGKSQPSRETVDLLGLGDVERLLGANSAVNTLLDLLNRRVVEALA